MPVWGGLILAYAAAIGLAYALSVPAVSFLVMLLSFGLAAFLLLAVGLVALLGPVAVLIHAAWMLVRRSSLRPVLITLNVWLLSLIVHAGASQGQSRWGDAGSVMGAKNSTYAEAFFLPITFFSNRLRTAG